MSYFVYILQSDKDRSYYIGHTGDLEQRLWKHNTGQSGYTKSKRPWKIVYKETYKTESEASIREMEIKKMKSRKHIELLINKQNLKTD